MSKVARKPVHIPENTKVSINNNEISVEGPLGKMSFTKENGISVSEIDGKLILSSSSIIHPWMGISLLCIRHHG